MRNAEGLVLDFAVAVVYGVASLSGQLFQLLEIGAAVVGAGGQGHGGAGIGGEQAETLGDDPVAGSLGHATMTGIAVFQALSEHLL